MAAWALPSCVPRQPDPRPNIVLVVIDTLRHDRVGCYGAGRDTTPALDGLAAEGVRFERAYATAPWTCPSVTSILTGRAPSNHGVEQPMAALAANVETLAEALRDAGYATAGVISNPHLRPDDGYDQGFDVWLRDHAVDHRSISTPGVTEQAVGLVEELAATERPFFLFVLYFDPHNDYLRHPEYGFATDPGRLQGTETIDQLRRLGPTMTRAESQYLRDSYDEEIRFTDAGVGEFLGALRRAGEYDDTAIVITADHGEEFLERGWIGHCQSLYEELVRIPLVVRFPGGTPRVVDTPVSLVSLAPTLLEVAGLDPGGHGSHAPSLLPLIDGSTPPTWPAVFCEVDFTPIGGAQADAHKQAVLENGFKLIHDDVTGRLELYDLAVDPGERRDLADQRPELVSRLRGRLAALRAAAAVGAVAGRGGARAEPSEEELELLRSLGYVGGAPVEPASGGKTPAGSRDR